MNIEADELCEIANNLLGGKQMCLKFGVIVPSFWFLARCPSLRKKNRKKNIGI
jgi:hypothetical protein